MKATLLNRMGSFILGGGTGVTVALASLALWTGTTDLEAIRQQFSIFESSAETQVNEAVSHYQVTVENANAEIGEYKDALAQANDNIDTLINAYMLKEEELTNKQAELESANSTYEKDLAELQTKLAEMETRLDSQYETDMNAVVEEANKQIKAANEAVSSTRTQIESSVENSGISDGSYLQGELDKVEEELVTGGDKSVVDISGIIE